ncbi:MAG: translation initiation factor IF-2 [Pseudomonadota bacterium]
MLRSLSDEEYARRLEALKQARKAEEEQRKRAEAAERARREEEAKRSAEEAEQRKRDAEEAAVREAAEAERRAAEEAQAKRVAETRAAEETAAETAAREAKEAKDRSETEAREAEERSKIQARRAAEIAAGATPAPGPGMPGLKIISRAEPKPEPKESTSAPTRSAEDKAEDLRARKPGVATPRKTKGKDEPATTRGRGDDKRRTGKLTISKLSEDGEGGRQKSLAAMRRRQERDKRKSRGQQEAREKVFREVKVPDVITVQELANRMTERVADVIKALMKNDMMVTQNQAIDQETAELIVEEFGHKFIRVSEADVETAIATAEDRAEDQISRAPVVTIMGHVDHGKTSLLDALRKTNVVAGEAGGITQHIGAYQIATEAGQKITFLDTPGHAAFTSMRARGAQVTDIVILVVAADDAVMPQTIEAISHAKAAEVPMIVAINKIDRPGADPSKVRTDLLRHEVVVEGMGGEVLDVEVSALQGTNLDSLVENIVLQSELLDLKANPERAAEGAVIEAKLDVGRGPVATVLVQRGTLRLGDIFVVGEQWGRVRALVNDQGERVEEAGPSVPVEVLGLNGTPEAGDVLNVVEDEAKAREISDYRQRKAREKLTTLGTRASLDQLLAQAKSDADVKELPVVVKSDVQGSSEAIVQALEKLGNEEVRVRVLHSGVGAVTESDVNLAEASGAPIIGFNVRANAPARQSANQKGVEIRYYSIIYDLVDDMKAAAEGLLSPEVRESFIGYARIKQVFKVSGIGKVAGCEVSEGVARRSAGVRLLRDNVVIHEGTLKTLKRFKDEVKEVQVGQECGMAFENYEDIREDDVIEIFERETVQRTLA